MGSYKNSFITDIKYYSNNMNDKNTNFTITATGGGVRGKGWGERQSE